MTTHNLPRRFAPHWQELGNGCMVRITLKDGRVIVAVRDDARAEALGYHNGSWFVAGRDIPHSWPDGKHEAIERIEALAAVTVVEPIHIEVTP